MKIRKILFALFLSNFTAYLAYSFCVWNLLWVLDIPKFSGESRFFILFSSGTVSLMGIMIICDPKDFKL